MTGSLKKMVSGLCCNSGRALVGGLSVAVLFAGAGCNGVFPQNPDQNGNPTEFSGIEGCATSFSDDAFNYGFDLPPDAQLVRTKNDSNALTNSLWTFNASGVLVNVITRVEAVSSDDVLGSLVSFDNDLAVSAGADLLVEEVVALSNGGSGFETVLRFDGLTTYRVQALANSRLFTVEAVVEESARTSDSDSLMSDIVLSLCLGN